MAMPYMEGVTEKLADQWLTQLTNQMKSIPQAKDKSILELQAQNWQKMVSIRLFLHNNSLTG